jgi:hypothetical protein
MLWPPGSAAKASCTTQSLEEELQPQLEVASSAGTEHRVLSGLVRRGATAAHSIADGRIVLCVAIGPAVGIGKVWMVEDVEELDAELRLETFSQLPVLLDG